MSRKNPGPNEAGSSLLGKILVDRWKTMSPALAKAVMKLKFSKADHDRMTDLLERNREGKLSLEERDELFAYSGVGCIFSILHVRARKALNKLPPKLARSVNA